MEIIELGSIIADTKLMLVCGPLDSIPEINKHPAPV